MAEKEKTNTLSAGTDDKFAAGQAVEQLIRRLLKAPEVTDIDYVLVLSGGKLGVTPVSNFKVEYTLTVVPTPSGATVILNGTVSDTITVLAGSSVLIEVSASGFMPYSQTVIMNSDKEIGVVLERDYIFLTPTSFEFDSDPSVGNKLSLSTPGTWIASGPSWITISNSRGTGDAEITFDVSENEESEERTGDIVITSQTGIQAYVSVTQAAKIIEELSVSPTSSTLDYEGGSFTLTITSNTSWKITSSGDISLGFSSTSGTGNGTVTVTYTQNPSTTNRPTGTITVETESGSLSANVSLTQNAATPAVTISPTRTEVTLGNNLTFNVSVNEYTDSLRVYVTGWDEGNGGITYLNMQGSQSVMITQNGTYSVTPGDSFNMIVSTSAASSGIHWATMGIELTPYNGEQSGTGVSVEISILS